MGNVALVTGGSRGIGLAIVQSVATVHRGKVRARCPEQNVLQITVSLPG